MHVLCLCARWCQLCNAYRETFEAVAARHRAHQFAFIDIEDEASLLELIEAVDVVDFPTLLIIDAAGLQFSGSVTPHIETLERLIRAADSGSFVPPQIGLEPGALQALLEGISTRHLYWAAPAPNVSAP